MPVAAVVSMAVISRGSIALGVSVPLGDGQVDFKTIFSKLTQYDFHGWAVLEWECCLKDAQTGAREGSDFIRRHIIPVSSRAFDDFAAGDEVRK